VCAPYCVKIPPIKSNLHTMRSPPTHPTGGFVQNALIIFGILIGAVIITVIEIAAISTVFPKDPKAPVTTTLNQKVEIEKWSPKNKTNKTNLTNKN